MTRIWALKGSRPRIVRQQQSLSVYLFGAVCPATDQAVGLVLPYANKEMMAHHLTQISLAVPKGRHAVLVVDQATFHKTDKLICPDNISLLFLPPYAPELNPVENLWAQLRHGWLANRCFEGYDAIVEACCEAWNAYTTRHNATVFSKMGELIHTIGISSSHANQLYRYFSAVQEVRFGVLTNGIVYRFFSDIEAENLMDDKPFFELDLLEIRESLVEELKKFTKTNFDIDNILNTASELKYTREIKGILTVEYESPTEGFVRFCIGDVYSGLKTQSVVEQFADITRRAFHQFVNDQINERLKSALVGEDADEVAPPLSEHDPIRSDDEEGDARIVTTEEEWEAFFAVKSILYDTIDLSRIAMRDRVSYCGILLDDNNRKPICRLHFNGSQKYLGVFDANKKEVRMPIDSVNDIYQHSGQLKSICHVYEG